MEADLNLKKIDREFHRKTASQYDRRIDIKHDLYHRLFLYPFIDELLQLRRKCQGGEFFVLDVGCGTGSVAIPLAEKGFDVIAVDHSPEMIEIARAKTIEKGLESKIKFVRADAEKMCFKNSRFDAVTCQGVIHHIVGKKDLILEICRVSKPSCYFYISEPCEIFSGFKIMTFLVKLYHFLKREADIEAPIVKEDLLNMIAKSGDFDYTYQLTFYIPYIGGPRLAHLRAAIVRALKNAKIGNLIFIRGVRIKDGKNR